MLQNGRENRSSSYELLRILAMFMIIGHHYSVHGIQHCLVAGISFKPDWLSGSFINRIFTDLLVPGGQIGVGIFFALTGYFMINKTPKIEKILKLTITVFFYSLLLLFLYIVLKIFNIYSFHDYTKITSIPLVIGAFLPISSGSWWFISAYFLLYLFIPIINKYLLKLNKVGFFAVLLFMWAFWYSSSVFGYTYSSLQKALFFYSVGSYLRLYSSLKNKKLYILIFILMWLCFSVSEYIRNENILVKVTFFRSFLTLSETAIFTPVAIVSLVKFFGGLNISYNNLINKISSTTFGIYIIHDSTVGRTLIWDGIAKSLNQYNSVFYPIYAVITILLVFVICSFVDLLRLKFIEPILWNNIYKKYLIIKKKIIN